MQTPPPPPPNVPPPLVNQPVALVPLEKIPFPKWLAVLTAITVISFILGITRIGHSFGSAITYERTKRLVAKNESSKAAPMLAKLSEEFPNSLDLKIDLADAYTASQDWQKAAEVLQQFEGVKVSKEQDERLNEIERRFPEIKEVK